MQITTELVLAIMKYGVITIGIIFASTVVIAGIVVRKVGQDAVTPVLHLVARGDALRMLTVIFIVGSATGLVVLGKIDGGQGATILSGIAGYVLGSGARPRATGAQRSEEVHTQAHTGQQG